MGSRKKPENKHTNVLNTKCIPKLQGLFLYRSIGVARGAPGVRPPPNEIATSDKNVTKSLLFFQFKFLLASSRTTVHVCNSN